MATPQKTGTAATAAILAALGSIVGTFLGHAFLGLLAGLAAIFLGFLGFLMAASPRVSGGILSLAAILLGVLGIALAMLRIVGGILF